jgi:fructan beta-fructosidase
MHRFIHFAFLLAGIAACTYSSKKMESTYQETYRPQLHFSPQKNWMNDPNGLVYLEGEYHLFFQYNPYGDTWGHMSWGHAVSDDLLHWKELPVALEEYEDSTTGDSTMIFSGTAVIDKNNTAGFGANAMVAIYTSHVHKNNQAVVQHQSLAYSLDKGRTWKRYSKNPILDIQRKDFRDPKVFWYEPQRKWVMALVVPDLYKVQLYSSPNLREWKWMSEFGDAGDRKRIWECPDLFELPVENDTKTKWVLSLSGSHPSGPTFVGMQYFVGEFDGTSFKADDTTTRYVDYGKDFYAGIIYNNLDHPQKKKVMIGWVNNWTYGNQIPTSPWRSAMSLPRELSLAQSPSGLQLGQSPVTIEKLRKEKIKSLEDQTLGGPFEFSAELTDKATIELTSEAGDRLILSFANGQFSINRRQTKTDFNPDFSSIDSYSISQNPSSVKIRVIIDQSIAEIFIDGGMAALTEQFYFQKPSFRIKLSEGVIVSEAYTLKSTWQNE